MRCMSKVSLAPSAHITNCSISPSSPFSPSTESFRVCARRGKYCSRLKLGAKLSFKLYLSPENRTQSGNQPQEIVIALSLPPVLAVSLLLQPPSSFLSSGRCLFHKAQNATELLKRLELHALYGSNIQARPSRIGHRCGSVF